MMSASAVFVATLTMFVGLLTWAAVSDFRRYIIPNQVSLGLLALYPAFVLSAPEPVYWQGALIMAAIFFVVGFVMYLVRAMGAGDAKLLPVVMLWVGPKDFAIFLAVMLGASFVLAGVVGLRMALAQVRANELAGRSGDCAAAAQVSPLARFGRVLAEFRHVPLLKIQVPYGVAIAAGGIWVAVNTLFTTLR
ncbi:MAG: prepilin peptidase [Rhodospirillaceae bacterium]|nr:prepilin peptidase [Rhodospirillaceae bacterium]